MIRQRGNIIRLLNSDCIEIALYEGKQAKIGEIFLLYTEGSMIRDPTTDKKLGYIEFPLLNVRITIIKDNSYISKILWDCIHYPTIVAELDPTLIDNLGNHPERFKVARELDDIPTYHLLIQPSMDKLDVPQYYIEYMDGYDTECHYVSKPDYLEILQDTIDELQERIKEVKNHETRKLS